MFPAGRGRNLSTFRLCRTLSEGKTTKVSHVFFFFSSAAFFLRRGWGVHGYFTLQHCQGGEFDKCVSWDFLFVAVV